MSSDCVTDKPPAGTPLTPNTPAVRSAINGACGHVPAHELGGVEPVEIISSPPESEATVLPSETNKRPADHGPLCRSPRPTKQRRVVSMQPAAAVPSQARSQRLQDMYPNEAAYMAAHFPSTGIYTPITKLLEQYLEKNARDNETGARLARKTPAASQDTTRAGRHLSPREVLELMEQEADEDSTTGSSSSDEDETVVPEHATTRVEEWDLATLVGSTRSPSVCSRMTTATASSFGTGLSEPEKCAENRAGALKTSDDPPARPRTKSRHKESRHKKSRHEDSRRNSSRSRNSCAKALIVIGYPRQKRDPRPSQIVDGVPVMKRPRTERPSLACRRRPKDPRPKVTS